jgi:hypothetical protein
VWARAALIAAARRDGGELSLAILEDLEDGHLVGGIARDELRRIRKLTRAERRLERQLAALVGALPPELPAERGDRR